MSIRSRLLLAFVGMAVIVVTIFGMVAYRTAEDAVSRNEAAILQQNIKKYTKSLSQKPTLQNELESVSKSEHLSDALLVLVRDDNGTIVALQNDSMATRNIYHTVREAIADVDNSGAGDVHFDDQHYIWALSPLVNTQLELLVVQQPVSAHLLGRLSIANRLAIAGAIVIWVAIWGALIVASILSSRLQEHHDELEHQALHDSLTDLPNRSLLHRRLDQALAASVLQQTELVLIVMDLDGFKDVNDTLGHFAGDELLQGVGRRVRETLRDGDTVARLGGDEFAVLLPNTSADHAIACVDKIVQALATPFCVGDLEVEVQTSIGIALFPQHGGDPDLLLQHADVAMYQAKESKCSYKVYDPVNDSHSIQRLTLAGQLRYAIENEQLVLYYQPKIDLNSGRVYGVEALVRWSHPEHGIIPPDDFIGLAEQNSLITPLTQWVLDHAIQQCRNWQDSGIKLAIAVNLSARNLNDSELPNWIEEKLRTVGLTSDRLELELTESAMMTDVSCATNIFKQLTNTGMPLAIDDFGTGMSSLSYLKRLPVTNIKIDRSFVMDMAEDEDSAVIVRSIVDLAHNLGYRVIAEGVENKEVLNLLLSFGCDSVQGYYFSAPLPAPAFETWLQNYHQDLVTATDSNRMAPGAANDDIPNRRLSLLEE